MTRKGIVRLAVGLGKSVFQSIPAKYRLGQVYRKYTDLLANSRTWDREQVNRWQLEKLRDLLRTAGEETSYYRNMFKAIGFHPDDLKSFSDFSKLPLLDRETVQSRKEEFVSIKFRKKKLKYGTTGGSTGIPLGIYYVKGFYSSVETAFVYDIWRNFGFRESFRHVILRGHLIKDNIFEKHGLKILLSSFHMTDEHMATYIKMLNYYKPRYIQAYPSSISFLCKYMKENAIPRFEFLDLVMCSSENLYPFQKELVDEVLKVPICNLYGNTERTIIATNFRKCDCLHVYPEYGVAEILDSEGKECLNEGDRGEIVTTSFTNPAFFLIRYKTGDMATYREECCKCNWRYKVIWKIDGRDQEFLIGNSGKKIYMAALNVHSDIYDNVSRFQFEQNRPGYVQLNYIPKRSFSSVDAEKIFHEIKKLLGTEFQLMLSPVNEIALSKRGKYVMVKQNCNTDKNHLKA